MNNVIILGSIDDGGREEKDEEVGTGTLVPIQEPEPVNSNTECMVAFFLFVVIVLIIVNFIRKYE